MTEFFWLKGPWLTWLATIAYMYIVMKAGPDFMRNRKPYDLKLAIRLYNLLLVAINTYLFIGTVRSFRYGLDFWGCGQPTNPDKREIMLYYGHLFFHTRYLEFFDTFFFVLRKKDSQISFLHVFHHAIVPSLMYIGLKFYPLPFNSLLPATNMFVHIIMYAYYGLATFGPKIQRYLWWKKYLTTMQISQFALLIIHCTHALIHSGRPDCRYPLTMVCINFCIGLTFLSLFISFYRQTYKKDQRTPRSLKQTDASKITNGVKLADAIAYGKRSNSITDEDSLIKQKYS